MLHLKLWSNTKRSNKSPCPLGSENRTRAVGAISGAEAEQAFDCPAHSAGTPYPALPQRARLFHALRAGPGLPGWPARHWGPPLPGHPHRAPAALAGELGREVAA